jgi:hypothetical protein
MFTPNFEGNKPVDPEGSTSTLATALLFGIEIL